VKGMASQADLARHWGLTRSRAWQIVREPGFPEPVACVNGCDVWFVAEVEHWRKHERALFLAREKVARFAPELVRL
jgi:predicted DNA-binding transcriptional regulator AlpA